MAEMNVRMRVVTETAQAKKDLDEVADAEERIGKAAEKTQQAASRASAVGGASPVDTKQVARDMADEFGRRAGAALGKFIGGFIVNEGVSLAFELARKPGEDTRRIDQAESTLKGALSMGTAGAMVAGPLGAVVGGLLGGLNNFILKEKEIQDGIRNARLDYERERKYTELDRRARQEEEWFDWSLDKMSPQRQIAYIQRREEELVGSGNTSDELLNYIDVNKKEKAELESELSRLRSQVAMVERGQGVNGVDGTSVLVSSTVQLQEAVKNNAENRRRIAELEKKLGEVNKDLKGDIAPIEAALEGKTKDANGRDLEIGGNKLNTRQAWESIYNYALANDKYGKDDERTKMAKKQLDIMNSQIDPLQSKENALYRSEMDKMLSLAGRSAITDNLSSKGLVVGAQVGSMGNDRIIGVIEKFRTQAREGNKSIVEVIRDNGGIKGMRDEFAKVF